MERSDLLLNKKLTGEIDQFEEIEFQDWLKQSHENELHYRRLQEAWANDKKIPWVKGQKITFDRISKRLDFEENISANDTKRPKNGWKVWYKVAAAIALLLAISILIDQEVWNEPGEISNFDMIHKVNQAGQKTRINLLDGSVCWLNSESEISYLPNFSKDSRDIYLKGEAYFQVAKDARKPFNVHTPSMTITAIGTAFNVSSYSDSESETVALAEGKISVKCQDGFYSEITPGHMVTFNKSSNSSSSGATTRNYAEWKDGVLRFDEVSYQTIITKLEKWYGVTFIVVGTPPADLKYKAVFKNEILANILESMKYGHHFEFEIDGKSVKLMFN